jgi:hypothetical protein
MSAPSTSQFNRYTCDRPPPQWNQRHWSGRLSCSEWVGRWRYHSWRQVQGRWCLDNIGHGDWWGGKRVPRLVMTRHVFNLRESGLCSNSPVQFSVTEPFASTCPSPGSLVNLQLWSRIDIVDRQGGFRVRRPLPVTISSWPEDSTTTSNTMALVHKPLPILSPTPAHFRMRLPLAPHVSLSHGCLGSSPQSRSSNPSGSQQSLQPQRR